MKQFFSTLSKKNSASGNIKTGKFLPTLLLFAVLLLGHTTVNAQTVTNAVQSGQWNDPDTWDNGIPNSSTDAVIANNFLVEISTSSDNYCANLTLGVGDDTQNGSIIFVGVSSLTVSDAITVGDVDGAVGTITLDNGAILTCGRIIEGDPDFSGIYETNLGSVVFTGTFSLPYNLFQFNNLTVNTGVLSTGGRNLPIEGDLTINNGGTLDLGENTANRNTIAGTLSINNGGTLRIGGGGTIPANFSTHVIGATSTIEYYGVAQTVATLNSGENYGNLIISGSGLKEVNGTIGIERDLTINSGIFSINTFTSNRTTSGGILTVANGATLRIAGGGSLPSNFSTHVIGATSTIEYSGILAQNIATLNSSQKYGNLTITNSTKTLLSNTTVAGTLTFGGSNNKLVVGSNTLTLEGGISNSTTARSITGSSNSNLIITGAVDRTIFFDATTSGTTNSFNNITLNHSGNITTLGNDVTVNNNLTITAGKLSIATRTLTIKGNLVNTVAEGIRGSSSSKLVFNGSTSPTLSMDQTTNGTTNMLSTLQINSSGQIVTLDNNLHMNSTLTFTAGKLFINGKTLTLRGLVTNTTTGGLRGSSTSNLVINGTVSPTLSFDQTTEGSTNVLNNLTINSNNQTVTLANALRLLGTHTPTAGVLASAGNLTLASTASNTANIASGNTIGGYITGDVTVERYIPQNSNRAWRLLTSPTNGQTIKQAWQEDQDNGDNNTPGYGTNITSSSASWSTDGFDFRTTSNSVLTYNQSLDTLEGLTTTNIGLNNYPGYYIYIRGDRSVTPSGSIVAGSSTVLRTKGTLNTGDQSTITVPSGKSALIGNPYASTLDIRNIGLSGGCVGTSFYVWDPKLQGAYSLGAYQTLTLSGGNYLIVPGGGSYGSSGSVVNTIQSGTAFLVESVGSSGGVTITESCKTSGSSVVLRPSSGIADKNLIINLFALRDSSKYLADGNVVFFNNNFNNGIDGDDNKKMINFGENISMIKNGAELAVERRMIPTGNDTIQYAVFNLKRISYELQILADKLNTENVQAFLEDKYLQTSTPIALDDTTYYTFSVNTTPGSYAENRFKIVFKPFSTLPVSITRFTATKIEKKVMVEWQVSNQINTQAFQIEKSVDGLHFTTNKVIQAQNNNTATINYSWLDEQPYAGINYYRLKSIDNDGRFTYSTIVKVSFQNNSPVFTISPNPSNSNNITIQFNNQPLGQYTIAVINSTGQTLYTQKVNHTGNFTSNSINLPTTIKNGTYEVKIVSSNNIVQIQKLLILKP
jgi:hypothetical protein